ncbi:MAG: hypothetical protein DI598_16790 [Pseudopedobacter saltans]|uniref:Uncharacterized protein n=1 Tax=Pseudopedobacter saltans TaxID=151895 RepID=A0A2W5EMT7_9SPHI|nr:MAG: hypothetical protein DI598_16790 [Pseudopedobacter saltans]
MERSEQSTEQQTHLVDTSSYKWKNTTTKTLYYGDTLKGSLYFDIPDSIKGKAGVVLLDSLESNGIKITIGILPSPTGIKTQIKAISKPQNGNETTINEGSQSQGTDLKSNTKAVIINEQSNKNTSTSYGGWVKGLVVFLLILSAIFFVVKKFNLWQKLKTLVQKIIK